MRPPETDYAAPYASYVSLVPEDDVLEAIERQSSETQKLLASLDDARAAFRYAEGKWSIKEVVGHLSDAERIMSYRALAIARGETQSLPGFDENDYMRYARFDDWRLGDLAEQYALGRRANIVFVRNLPADAWDRRGVANDTPITVRALAYIIVGHERHHLKVLKERYLVG
jgi:DinB family protein